jgi:hypothetical protein
MKNLALFLMALFLGSLAIAPADAKKVGSATFSGNVVHVSSTNIKIYNPADKTSMAFTILPKFDKVFSGDGKTTYQMRAVKAGAYVKVYYDQSFLGMRHADKIYVLRQNNSIRRTE